MIFGVGTDLVSVERIEKSLNRHGERFARRILDDAEFEEFSAHAFQAAFLAKRFAAKEAMSKALGTGLMRELGFSDLAVGHDERGKPIARLSEKARDLLRDLGVAKMHISISDDQGLAMAFAVAESASDGANY